MTWSSTLDNYDIEILHQCFIALHKCSQFQQTNGRQIEFKLIEYMKYIFKC